MTTLQTLSDSQVSKEVPVNENFDTLSAAGIFGKRHPVTSGLTWGYYGGRYNGNTVADGTVTLTNSATNYVVVNRSTGVVSVSTSATNYNDTTNYARLYQLTVSGGVVTATVDGRMDTGGLLNGGGGGGGGGTELKGLVFTSDTGSTADSDPGNGLFKWNNATQSNATALYVDNQTEDGVSVTEYWSDLPTTGHVYIQQGDDATRWQLWRWGGVTLAAGYFKLTSLQLKAASASAIEDGKSCYLDFDADANTGGGGSTQGKHSIPVMAPAILPTVTGGCESLAVIASGSNQPDISTLNFDASTEEYALFAIAMPKKWNEGTITAKFLWSHPSTTTNFDVIWGIQAVAVGNDDAIGAAYGTAQTVTDTGGTTNDLYHTAETSAITVAGSPAAEDVVFFRVYRDADAGGDTMAVDARLHGVVIYITTDADTDA